ncbi:MAG TPA: hypothetical protein IAA13_04515 [Candidatus Alistipes merdigallinarum]|nr:hypothetical protein [Candidatus Alistipes merdigallinarum]
MKKYGWLLLSVFLFASCVRISDLSYDGIESVEVVSVGMNQSAVDLFVRASNVSGTNLTVVKAELTLDRDGVRLAQVEVGEKVKLPKRFEGTVRVPVKIRIEGGLFGMASIASVLSNRGVGTTVSGEVVVKAGLAKKRFKIENMDTGRFLRQFGIDTEEIIKGFAL